MIGNDVEGSGSVLISDTIPQLAWKNEENNRNHQLGELVFETRSKPVTSQTGARTVTALANIISKTCEYGEVKRNAFQHIKLRIKTEQFFHNCNCEI
jgi:hypothetical protein